MIPRAKTKDCPTPLSQCLPQPVEIRRFGLVWFLLCEPKSQNARMWRFLWKLPYCEWVYTHIQLIGDHHTFPTADASKSFFCGIWGRKPVENLAYRKFLQVLKLFNNVLKTPEELQSHCKWIVYKCQIDRIMPLVENVAKMFKSSSSWAAFCANLQILFILSSSATGSTGFTDLFDQINFDSEFLSLFRGVPFLSPRFVFTRSRSPKTTFLVTN